MFNGIQLLYKVYYFRIRTKDFLYYRDQIVELFPTELPNLFYVPYSSSKKSRIDQGEEGEDQESEEEEEEELQELNNEGQECIGQSGALYNYYKAMRKQLRIAGILQVHKKRKIESDSERIEEEPTKLLGMIVIVNSENIKIN